MWQVGGIGLRLGACLCLLAAATVLADDQFPPRQFPPQQMTPPAESVGATPARRDCGCRPVCNCGNSGVGLFDNVSLFLGLEGSKQPQDYGVNAHFGGRFAADMGMPLIEDIGLGLQVGTSINYTDNAVQFFEKFGEATGRFQSFTTVGLFQRNDAGLVWGGAVDYLHQTYYDTADLFQFRGRVGWQFTEQTEVGFLTSLSNDKDRNSVAGVPITLAPLNQGSVYFKQRWESQAETMLWVGIAESHGERNLAFEALLLPPANARQRPAGERLVFGAQIHVPLNDYVALFGQGNFILPADTGTVDSYLGFVVYPSGGAKQSQRSRFAPLMPVANSTNFSVNLR